MQLIQRETNIPVPHVHVAKSNSSSPVGAPFMLVDCLRGNMGMDLSMAIPSEYKLGVFASTAEIQIEVFNMRLPKIGKIVGINNDGSYRQGPIPGLSGPFNTAADFFRAWSTKVDFGLSHDQLEDAAGSFADELSFSGSAFKTLMNDMADRLSICNEGPFPVCHGDFGHSNIVFDDNYRSLGVID
ncbi:Phosphotransferase enzyme family protein [Aspergillus parasiticus SU-1]|uniref:Phosphotransferase enzyme family protein n=1 Tax=Aspergillus parasiticus (strain ATCC 56775 / NRRL 5862 / SRRC 143 / SU-1) TaxID=1403190 RepID=A0A0F0I899_ASPPU|nr:Phosphotransferase enzyme family protein [Aspergillus parasiticus SU-1]